MLDNHDLQLFLVSTTLTNTIRPVFTFFTKLPLVAETFMNNFHSLMSELDL